MRLRHVLVCCTLMLPCSEAVAQDTRNVGITMGYPASIGVLWHATDKVAIRPDFAFSGNSLTETPTVKNSTRNVAIGVSALFYIRKDDHVRTYVVPRLDYSRSSSSQSAVSSTPALGTARWDADLAGSFGAQCALGDRFSVFAEVGVGVSHSTLPVLPGITSGSANSWGTRSGVGVIFYP